MRGLRLSMPDVDPILDRSERSLVDRALAHLRDRRPRDSAHLWAHIKRVALLGEVLQQTPSLLSPATLGGSTRDAASLAAELSRLDPMAVDILLPEKAVIARAFLDAKIVLLRGFLTALGPGAPGHDEALWRESRAELAQSIYTLIASEVLIGLCGERELAERTRLRAARQLMLIWDRATEVEIDDFCPLLEAALRARLHVAVKFGALLGAGEYLRLIGADCPGEFLDYFTADDASDDAVLSLDEFLFGLPYEDLGALRSAMRRDGRAVVDAAYAEQVLGRPLDWAGAVDDPEAFYRSYRRRRTAAEFRRLIHAPGPTRVAEGHIMIYVLERDATQG